MDLIDRQAAIKAVHEEFDGCIVWDESGKRTADEFENIIDKLPSAQSKRSIGYWQITDAYPHNVFCSECHARFAQTNWAVWEDGSLPRRFCPNCGADMRGGEDG